MAEEPESTRIWDRSRQALRAELVEVSMRLFIEQGFEATTIDQIATAAGISRRSLFRYFGSKEDIVLEDTSALCRAFTDELERRPATEGLWEALRHAALAMGGAGSSPERTLAVARLLESTPSVRARHLEKRLQWQDVLIDVTAKRMGIGPDRADALAPAAILSTVLACLDVAVSTWVARSGKGSIEDLFDQAIAAVRASPS